MKLLTTLILLVFISVSRACGTEPEIQMMDQAQPVLFGKRMQFIIHGGLQTKLIAKLALQPSSLEKVAQLYLNGVYIPNLKITTSKTLIDGKEQQILQVVLDRDANDTENRQAWDRVLREISGFTFDHSVDLAVGVVGEIPVQAGKIKIAVNNTSWIFAVIVAGVLGFWVMFVFCIKRSNMLRDGGAANAAYSLGKTQMAYWGLMVLFCFACIWIISGRMERIPAQVLVLLGISSSTGLAALAIGSSKQTEAAKKKEEATKEEAVLQAKAPAARTAEDNLRLTQISNEIVALQTQSRPCVSEGFWKDLCTDENGISFHRLQIVLWTFVLGGIFVHSVILTLSMPEFSETLLTLMGISNGTYLGFKIPEKQ